MLTDVILRRLRRETTSPYVLGFRVAHDRNRVLVRLAPLPHWDRAPLIDAQQEVASILKDCLPEAELAVEWGNDDSGRVSAKGSGALLIFDWQ